MSKIYGLYWKLKEKYGLSEEVWQLWCKRNKTSQEKEEIIIGAILTQRTNWRNVEKALANLRRKNILSLDRVFRFGQVKMKELEELLWPSGFYKEKAKRLFALCRFFANYSNWQDFFQEDLQLARNKLLNIKGVGPETADTILLYSGGKPIFVIDEYTKRFTKRHKLATNFSYDFLQKIFQDNLPKDPILYQDFHAFIVQSEKALQTKSESFRNLVVFGEGG